MAKQNVSMFDGTLVHVGGEVKRFDRGAAIPENADENHVAILKDRGMVAEGEPVAGVAPADGPVAFDVDEDAAKAGDRKRRNS